jgi:hypothetical protein
VRPGETIAGISLQGETWFNSMVNLVQAPITYAEIGLWLIPISTLDQVFIEMYAASGEDVFEELGVHQAGSGLVIADLSPVTDQGHKTPGLQQNARRWAGEIGGQSGGSGLSATSYLPYVSFGTYKTAVDWYDLANTNDFSDKDLFDNPPLLEKFIRSATDNGFSEFDPGVDATTATTQSLSSLVERLFILTRGEVTYAEILAAHGVDPKRAGAIAQPLLLEQGVLVGQDTPQLVAVGQDDQVNDSTADASISSGFTGDRFGSVVSQNTDGGVVANVRPVGALRKRWNAHRSRNVFVDEPSIILGTHVWWSTEAAVTDYGHMFDVTRIIGPGQWGQVQNGGVDEEDFVTVQELYARDGTAIQAGGQGESGTNVFNSLNTFMHGDKVTIDGSNSLANSNDPFGYRNIGGTPYSSINQDATAKLSCQLHVLSDLVGS